MSASWPVAPARLLRNNVDHAHRRGVHQDNPILRHGVFDALRLGRGRERASGKK